MKNILSLLAFARLYDLFGEQAAKDILKDVNDGKVSAEVIEKYIFSDISKEEYSKQLKEEYKGLT